MVEKNEKILSDICFKYPPMFYYENKSGIMKNLEDFPMVSPHWPGVGRYVGDIDDEQPVLFENSHMKIFNIFDYYDKYDFQKRRVYGDEIKAISNYKEK